MTSYENTFIKLAKDKEALLFGDFTLKSGIKSNIFFNIANLNDGLSLFTLANCYADMIVDKNIEFDMIFGPAYKGIHLAAAVAMALSARHKINIPFAFNRKEEKTHGEGGTIIGAPIQGKVLIIDDVVTRGTACREAIGYILAHKAEVSGLAVALDREELHSTEHNTVAELLESEYNIRILSITKLARIK